MPRADYDLLAGDYAALRRPDPRIARAISDALGAADTVLNVGAGAGSYEPDRPGVVAVGPSGAMIRARSPGAAPIVRARAERLPFADRSFDACIAVLTVHHWTDVTAGLAELRRTSRGRVAILTFDPAARPWLTDYLPALLALDERQMPPIDAYAHTLGPVRVETVPVPNDCTDGFLYAYWARPRAYLDARLRAGSSSFSVLPDQREGLARLERDLDSGAWRSRYAELLTRDAYDAGYRLIIAGYT